MEKHGIQEKGDLELFFFFPPAGTLPSPRPKLALSALEQLASTLDPTKQRLVWVDYQDAEKAEGLRQGCPPDLQICATVQDGAATVRSQLRFPKLCRGPLASPLSLVAVCYVPLSAKQHTTVPNVARTWTTVRRSWSQCTTLGVQVPSVYFLVLIKWTVSAACPGSCVRTSTANDTGG